MKVSKRIITGAGYNKYCNCKTKVTEVSTGEESQQLNDLHFLMSLPMLIGWLQRRSTSSNALFVETGEVIFGFLRAFRSCSSCNYVPRLRFSVALPLF